MTHHISSVTIVTCLKYYFKVGMNVRTLLSRILHKFRAKTLRVSSLYLKTTKKFVFKPGPNLAPLYFPNIFAKKTLNFSPIYLVLLSTSSFLTVYFYNHPSCTYWSTRPTHSHGRQESLFSYMLSIHPSLPKCSKAKQQKTMFSTGMTMGLAEWIIDDTCLVFLFFLNCRKVHSWKKECSRKMMKKKISKSLTRLWDGMLKWQKWHFEQIWIFSYKEIMSILAYVVMIILKSW